MESKTETIAKLAAQVDAHGQDKVVLGNNISLEWSVASNNSFSLYTDAFDKLHKTEKC